jgi:hypothetical protein
MFLRFLLILSFAAALPLALDAGSSMDPNGASATYDAGWQMDPNGASLDDGPGLDPDGAQVCYSACVDPNG